MATTKKMPYTAALSAVLEGRELTDEVLERLEALKASLEKKNSRKVEGPTKAQKENAELAEKVLAVMEPETVYSSAELGVIIPELAEMREGVGASAQKITSIMKVLGDRVITEKVKGKSTYRLA